jgi:hypothetical protein
MVQIASRNDVVTLINVFTVSSENQHYASSAGLKVTESFTAGD